MTFLRNIVKKCVGQINVDTSSQNIRVREEMIDHRSKIWKSEQFHCDLHSIELPVIDVCMVTYNSKKWLDAFLNSLEHQNYPLDKLNLFFTDNGSKDGTVDFLNDYFTKNGEKFAGYAVSRQKNLGFGAGTNNSILQGKSEYCLITNVDLEFLSDSLINVIQIAVQDTDKEVACWELRQAPAEMPKYYDPVSMETAWCSHACILMRRSAYKAVGGYDKNLFMYAEDVELSFRFRNYGYVLKYVPQATIIHHTVEFYGQIKPTERIGCISGNIYLRFLYGNIRDRIIGLVLLFDYLRRPQNIERKRILKNTIRLLIKGAHPFKQKRRSAYFPFRNFDYEEGRIGHNYHIKTLPVAGNPTVDIIVISDGRLSELHDTLLSVMQQSYKDIRVIVALLENINKEEIEKYSQDARVRFVVKGQEKCSETEFINSVLYDLKDEYFMMIHTGDLLFGDHVEVLLHELELDQNAVAAYSISATIQEDLQLLERPTCNWAYESLLNSNYLPMPILLQSQLVRQRGGLYDTEDILGNLWVRYGYEHRFIYVPKTTSITTCNDHLILRGKGQNVNAPGLRDLISELQDARFTIEGNVFRIVNREENTPRIAGQLHIYYVDLAEELFHYANNISEDFDLYITTDTVDKASLIAAAGLKFSRASAIQIEVVPNRGRDVGPFIIQFQRYATRYSYFFHIHTKRSKHNNFGDRWREYTLGALLSAQNAADNIISAFDDDPRLGVVMPKPMQEILPFLEVGGNEELMFLLMDRLGVIDKKIDYVHFPAGDMFWGRVSALKQIFNQQFTLNDFPEEQGQIDGTMMHAIERSWCHLAKYNGFTTMEVDTVYHLRQKQKSSLKTRRLAMLTFWEKQGRVGEYVCQYLSGIKKVAERVLVIVNGSISEAGKHQLKAMGIELLIRENKGLDFSAWKAGIDYLGYDCLNEYEELILTNCSCYGPVGGFEKSVEEMTVNACDFWGYTLHNEDRNTLIVQGNPDSYVREHLQSYFLVFKRSVITSKAFRKWWEELTESLSFRDEVNRHENRFTEYLANSGFHYESYYRNNACMGDPCFENVVELLQAGVPVFKRKLFSLPADELMPALRGLSPVDILRYVDENTKFDVGIVLKDLLETEKIAALKENLIYNTIGTQQMVARTELLNTIAYYENSHSWKFTKPLRFAVRLLKKSKSACQRLKNFYGLYGRDGIRYSLKRKLGMYKYPQNDLREYDENMPIYVISYNRLDCLKKLMDFFEKRNLTKNVIIIDNNSSYKPLLDYLQNVPCKVVFLKRNYGHLVLWKCHQFDDVILNEPFVLTDCDVVPVDEIPEDFMKKMYDALRNHSSLTKVGLSLSLDDIPDYYEQKRKVLDWEAKFWVNRMADDESLFDAPVDTTFAVYRPNVPPSVLAWWNSARTDKPYTARHLGWYLNNEQPTDEDIWYSKVVSGESSMWYGKDYLKKTNVR